LGEHAQLRPAVGALIANRSAGELQEDIVEAGSAHGHGLHRYRQGPDDLGHELRPIRYLDTQRPVVLQGLDAEALHDLCGRPNIVVGASARSARPTVSR